ncbi:MAG: hypothetical protein Q7Q73_04305 [Verrucomicrobiota bacterium JB024]|nr:hypothetical protein [Verrucomicrobiota bacterium JB024]
MKRTIEIDDTLQERIDTAIEEVEERLRDYLNDNLDISALPDLYGDLDYRGGVHDIIDGAVPVYTAEIKGLWFLYQAELEEAYKQAGYGDNPLENNGMSALYCYIEQQVADWYNREAEDIFERWQESRPDEDGE